MTRFLAILGGGLSLLVAGTAGCSSELMISTKDVIVVPDQDVLFTASVHRQYLMSYNQRLRDVEVRYLVDGQEVGRGRTDAKGQATVRGRVPATTASTYEARADVKGQHLSATGDLFHWTEERTIVAVDIDDCISHTSYSDLFTTRIDNNSRPFKNSAEVLRELEKDYHLVYFSARPRWLLDKTKQWLREHDFPPGPTLHAVGFEACLRQEAHKRRMLEEFRSQFPSMLIGIGDKGVDDRAYGANDMLAIILGSRPSRYRDHCIVLRNWEEIGRFFAAHRQRLADPHRLGVKIAANDMNLRPLFKQSEQPVDAVAGDGQPRPAQAQEVQTAAFR